MIVFGLRVVLPIRVGYTNIAKQDG